MKKNETKNVSRVCKGIGSQPCSCYYSNSSEILQFELSSDEITKNAVHVNGTGPATCNDLQDIGHYLNGFYFIRVDSTTIKSTFCKFNEMTTKTKHKENGECNTTIMEPSLNSVGNKAMNNMMYYIKYNLFIKFKK